MTPEPRTLTEMIHAREYDEVRAAIANNPALLEQPDEAEFRPLHIAAQESDLAMVALLLDLGADVNAKGYYGHTPLFWAARSGNRSLCDLLRQHGGLADLDRNVYMSIWHTPLAEALFAGDIELAQLLLDLGASPSGGDSSGSPLYAMFAWTAIDADLPDDIDSALLGNDSEERNAHLEKMHAVFHLLLESSSSLDAAAGGALIVDAARCADYFDRLDFSQEIGLLLDHGADIHATQDDCFRGSWRISIDENEWLSEYEPSDVTALHVAAYYGHLPHIQLLLARGADPNRRTSEGETPLHFLFFHPAPNLAAAWEERAAIFEALMASGANINAQDVLDKTPLHWVANAFLDTYSEYNSPPNPPSDYAIVLDQVLNLLAKHGADFTIKDHAGFTAANIAAFALESIPWLPALWHYSSLRALGQTENEEDVEAIQARIQRITTKTVAGGLTEAEISWLIESVNTLANPSLRVAAAAALVAIAQREPRLDANSLRVVNDVICWISDSLDHSDPQVRSVAARALGEWADDYAAVYNTPLELPQEGKLLNLSEAYAWQNPVISVLLKQAPRVAISLILLLGLEKDNNNPSLDYLLLNEQDALVESCRYALTIDPKGTRLFLRLMEEVGEMLPKVDQVTQDVVVWPQGEAFTLCAKVWAEIDLERAIALIKRLYIHNLISDATVTLIQAVMQRVAKSTLPPKEGARLLRALLPVSANVVKRSIESYAIEDSMSDYWNHTTLFDVAKEVPLSWQVAAAICSLDSVNTEAVWEEAVESLVPYHRLSKVCEYQIQSLCEVWDQWVNPTLTDPTMVLEILADKVVLLETKRFVPLLPHVMMTVLTQQDESELAIQVAALIKGQASPSRIDKEDHYIQLFLELWAKEDRDGLLNFTRSWTERQLRTQE